MTSAQFTWCSARLLNAWSQEKYTTLKANCDNNNILYLITCMRCLEQYPESTINLYLNFEFINLVSKLAKNVVGLLDTLITNVIIL